MTPPPRTPDDFRSDQQLCQALRHGDGAAGAELIRRHEQRLRAFVFGEPAWVAPGEEILRRTWATALHAVRDQPTQVIHFRRWLFTLAEKTARASLPAHASSKSRRLAKCFRRLRAVRPTWHALVVWVSLGMSRTALGKRLGVSKPRLRAKYLQALAAVRGCVTSRTSTTDPSNRERSE